MNAQEYVQATPLEEIAKRLATLSPVELLLLAHDWRFWARRKQLPPAGLWRVWLILAGRGFGKTLSGAQWVRSLVDRGLTGRIALVGATSADVRDTMVEGPSGLLAVFPPHQRPRYESSKRRVTFSNGAVGLCYSADEPERLRGPNFSAAWADEICAWRDEHAWEQLMLCLRAGQNPQVCVTTTPKPTPLIVRMYKEAVVWDGADVRTQDGAPCPVPKNGTVLTKGSTYENTANLAQSFVEDITKMLGGTRLGRQELDAEVLLDVPGALFRPEDIGRAAQAGEVPGLERVVVAVDPAPTSAEGSDLTGIVVAGKRDDAVWVKEDLSCRETPDAWARIAIAAYYRHQADTLVVERNRGGDMVKALIQSIDPNVPVKEVQAMRGKYKRAEPVAALYEQDRVKHGPGLERLEKQLEKFTGEAGRRDDRVDTTCWAVHELLLGDVPFVFV